MWVLFGNGWQEGERVGQEGAFIIWERKSDGRRWQISVCWDDTFKMGERP